MALIYASRSFEERLLDSCTAKQWPGKKIFRIVRAKVFQPLKMSLLFRMYSLSSALPFTFFSSFFFYTKKKRKERREKKHLHWTSPESQQLSIMRVNDASSL